MSGTAAGGCGRIGLHTPSVGTSSFGKGGRYRSRRLRKLSRIDRHPGCPAWLLNSTFAYPALQFGCIHNHFIILNNWSQV